MSAETIVTSLRRLLRQVALEPGTFPRDLQPGKDGALRGLNIPDKLLDDYAPASDGVWLRATALAHFDRVLNQLVQESEDGEFEHLSKGEIETDLKYLVCETWLSSRLTTARPPREAAEIWLDALRRPREEWIMLWRIKDLTLWEPLTVGEVVLVPHPVLAATDLIEEDYFHFWGIREKEDCFVFAKTTMIAGSRSKAIARGTRKIDDALHVLRVGLSEHKLLPEEQRRFRRDEQYALRNLSNPLEGRVGWKQDLYAVEVGLRDESLEIARQGVAVYSAAFGPSVPETIQAPYVRTVQWAGSAVMRTDWDDKIVDLCTALECLWTTADDQRKAQTIALRYMLAGFATGDISYVTHPLSIYNLYLLRNKIVHGAARRVGGEAACDALEYLVLDSLKRLKTFVEQNPSVQTLPDIYRQIATLDRLTVAIDFIEGHEGSGPAAKEPIKNTLALAREWIGRPKSGPLATIG